jgi:hypothetical protein
MPVFEPENCSPFRNKYKDITFNEISKGEAGETFASIC